MKVKLIKQLLSLTVRSAVCIAIFILLAGLKRFFPQIFGLAEAALEKSIDIKKAGDLLVEALREATPF